MRTWIGSVLSHARLRDDLRRFVSFGGQRVLIHEILSLQLLITAVIGSLAIAGLYWGGQWVLQKNYSRWAMQWTEELHELGAPLYLPYTDEVTLRLESYINKYPEIERVSYFRQDGSRLLFVSNRTNTPSRGEVESLSADILAKTAALVGTDTPYIIESSLLNIQQFEIFAPIWTASIANDGLFDFDPFAEQPEAAMELIGFVRLELNFAEYHQNLLNNIKVAILVLLVLLAASGFLGRMSLRRALRAISDLQKPIAELAKGNLAVEFKPAAHREISEIVQALETTATALGERDARLLRLANHDPLTGLFNRRRFSEELDRELRSASRTRARGALFFVDLDQFKYINDTCGHPAGDRLIKKVADRLTRSVGDDGIVARFGGDEFAILAPGVNKREATEMAEVILEDMRQLSHVEDETVFHVHCSVGMTMIKGGEATHDDLIAQADIACREAKARGRNRAEFYKVSRREADQMAADVGWMRKLREAIDSDAFILRYQPVVDIVSGETSHHEVLVRLRMDDGHIIGPDMFLPAAIRFGLMAEIDAWMVDHAIQAYAHYSQDEPDLRFAINLSSSAFETENLSSYVVACLEKHRVRPDRFMFEITENLAVRHLSHVEKQIAALRELGCEVALDDFGKGYSSLGYLQQLSVDYIKIDGSFIRNLVKNPVDQKMVRLIAEIGREAGMKTVAEYVQSAPAFSMLAELGVDYAQGFYVGKPAAVPRRRTLPVLLATKRRRLRLAEEAG
ncbi:MAG: EAL domain-containing protein [Gammaproteobacteria bacterium]|nr:EAL domain-containing protein [Gammaproteobacteria bacterium]MDH5311065.1 EAL domain-containing protein [Gammaproteobacteria bacterium]